MLGKYNTLTIVKAVEFGIYLDGGELGEILLPMRYVPENIKPGDDLEVFLYKDSEDRIIATTEQPLAKVGDFANLEVVAINAMGAFLNWGLMKDLLVPYGEQRMRMEEGKSYVVYVYHDESSDRIVASAKLNRFFKKDISALSEGEEVDILVYQQTDLGFAAVINQKYDGLIYTNEVFQSLEKGQKRKAIVQKIREDGKIDLGLQPPGYAKTGSIADAIVAKLKEKKGKMEVSDKSDPQLIYNTFGISKKSFKMALGQLYKHRRIRIEKDSIHLVE